ncbi:hypothetical protein ANN_26688 [Periplaneta americana]|uniref:Uncharacterized protein n=1 Tax=Periplaneta americana TaxID=6978 RepID=A0ABQ8RZ20_PERAM|nr:hypothetical protein ANN_26688 [Periplaneta americana]
MYNAALVSTSLGGWRSNRNPVPELEPNEFVYPPRVYEGFLPISVEKFNDPETEEILLCRGSSLLHQSTTHIQSTLFVRKAVMTSLLFMLGKTIRHKPGCSSNVRGRGNSPVSPVVQVIKELFAPEEGNAKHSRKITFTRCVTSLELLREIDEKAEKASWM